tara:strand:- start:219 stop:422 length:204 start_codon:yes stop_codon:yes gene_type:complete
METQIVNTEDINKIKTDLEIIKTLLLQKDPEGELSDWAKEELEKARSEPEENYTSLEDLKKEIEDGV